MAEPFLGEIRLFSFNSAPSGWAHCNGQLLPILQNQALFSILGTMYGGNGSTNFALPNLQGRVPIHVQDQAHTQGESAGANTVTLGIQQLPTHIHVVQGNSQTGDTNSPTGNTFADAVGQIYIEEGNLDTMQPATLTSVGGSQPHENRMPYLAVNFCIALQGIFPARN